MYVCCKYRALPVGAGKCTTQSEVTPSFNGLQHPALCWGISAPLTSPQLRKVARVGVIHQRPARCIQLLVSNAHNRGGIGRAPPLDVEW